MPTYTYRCEECGHQFDERQKFTDAPLQTCPSCGVDNGLRKVVNSVGIVFKGSGFYVTDNRNGSSGTTTVPAAGSKSDTADTGKESSTPSSDTTSAKETKPAADKSSTPKETVSA